MGRYELSAYECGDHIDRPHIGQIGADGVASERAYVTAPTCAPSRAGIITGRVQNRYGFETQLMEFYPTNMIEYLGGKYIADTDDWVVSTKPQYPSEWQVHKQGVPPTEITLPEIFKKAGYATAKIGKWHLGVSKPQLPENRGFDYTYGFHGAFSLYTPERNWSHVINHEHASFSAQHQWNNGRKGEGRIQENGKVIREEQYLTFAIRDKAINWIEEQKDNPFFLYLAFSAPHVPFQAPVDYYCQYSHIEDDNKRVYYAMISALDDAIGAVHQKIKDLGIDDNTIIYFISDNGGASYTEATENGPLKGGKLTQFEGGIQVPFVMKYPKKIPAGIRYEFPVSSTDIFATSLAQADIPMPEDRPHDGVNLIPYVTGIEKGEPHPQLFWRADHIWAVRDGDYKLILSTRDGWAELYDLSQDLSEKINLRDDMPELYEDLRTLHLQWQQNNLPDKPMWPRIMDHKFTLYGKEYLFPA
jgi:arylsulfatase A-like enzyme